MKRRDFLRTAGVAGVSAMSGCQTTPGQGVSRRPNIVFLLADQWRASATGYAGDPNVKTPNLDRLAGESMNFTNAVSVCPVSTPYRACLMTGQFPLTTGMFVNDLSLPGDALCMAEIYAGAGYDTGYIGKWHLDGHGRDAFIPRERRQGFAYWKVAECDHHYPRSHYYEGDSPEKKHWDGYDAFAQTHDAQAYLQNRAKTDTPFLLMVSYGIPHFPHETAPDEYRAMYPPASIQLPPSVPEDMFELARREASGYYGHCTALDTCVGDVISTLDETGLADNTILVFTSDHGEMLGSHGQAPLEKQRPWDESVLVPFLLRHPRLHGGRGGVVRTPVNAPDILPTLLGLCDIEVPGTVEGEDLSGVVRGDEEERDRAALIMAVTPFAGYHGGREFRGVRTWRHTYVRSLEGPWLLYDNASDPHQMNNLVNHSGHATIQADLDAKLRAELVRTKDTFQSTDTYLKAWGYSVDAAGNIPFTGDFAVQGPGRKVG